jgi:hypothetical protein
MTSGIRWTEAEDDKLKSMAIAGHSAEQIAAALHRSTSAAYGHSLRFGLSLRQIKRRPQPAEIGLRAKK